MKYVVIVGDGMPDYPIEEIGGLTPLEYAHTPHMDMMCRRGEVGTTSNVPEGMPAGSDVANLSLLGYDPLRYYTGRAPIEAVAMGVDLGEKDVAFRCNLVTLSQEEYYSKRVMLDYSADEISTKEAASLLEEISSRLGTEKFHFHAGVSYRHLMVWQEGAGDIVLIPPHDISGLEIGGYLPRGAGADVILELMENSSTFLPEHAVNKERAKRGLGIASSIWIWGQGTRLFLDSFAQKYALEGTVISAVDLVKGLGLCAGLSVAEVSGATGNINTNYRGKALKALEKLHAGNDFVFIHIEAPDEAGHRGELETKIKAIEEIDEKVVGEVLGGLDSFKDVKIMVLADHPTPLALRTHTSEAVPFVIYRKGNPEHNRQISFNEKLAMQGRHLQQGFTLMDYFILDDCPGGKGRL